MEQHQPQQHQFPSIPASPGSSSSITAGYQTVSSAIAAASNASGGGSSAAMDDSYFYNDSDLNSLDTYALLLMAGGMHPGNDPETQAYMTNLAHYLMGIGGSIVCCMGTIANAMSVAVLTRAVMKSSTYMYLAALAICDSLVLFFTLLLVLKDTKPPETHHQLDTFHAVLYPFVHPTAVVFQVTSIWLTLAFTVDRYIMICHPFKAEHMCRRSRARRVVCGIYIGGLLFNIPRYLETYTRTDEFHLANSTQVFKTYGVDSTAIGNNELFRKIIHSWGYLLFVCGIPFLTLVILNAFLIRAVRESRLKGKEINPKEKHRNDTTIMLIGVIIIFLICQGPALASRMIYAFKPATTKNKAVFTLNEVSNFLVILNSAINIVPYYLFGKKFRSEFWRIFCACFLDKDEMRRIVRSYSVSVDQRRLSNCNYNGMEMNGMGSSNKINHQIRASSHSVNPGDGMLAANYSSSLQPSTPGNAVNQTNGYGGQQHLPLPLIHNSNSNNSSASNSTTTTAEFDVVNISNDLNSKNDTVNCNSNSDFSKDYNNFSKHFTDTNIENSPAPSAFYHYPTTNTTTPLPPPPTTTTTISTTAPTATHLDSQSSPMLERQLMVIKASTSNVGNVNNTSNPHPYPLHHGKYMSISTNAPTGTSSWTTDSLKKLGAKSNL